MPMHYGMKGVAGEAVFVPKKMAGMAKALMKQPMMPTEKMVLGIVQDVETKRNRLENRLEKKK